MQQPEIRGIPGTHISYTPNYHRCMSGNSELCNNYYLNQGVQPGSQGGYVVGQGVGMPSSTADKYRK